MFIVVGISGIFVAIAAPFVAYRQYRRIRTNQPNARPVWALDGLARELAALAAICASVSGLGPPLAEKIFIGWLVLLLAPILLLIALKLATGANRMDTYNAAEQAHDRGVEGVHPE